MHIHPLILISTLLLAAPRSQIEADPPVKSPPSGKESWVELESWTQSRSRAAFSACDPNGDDRLSIFEASAAFKSIEGPQNPAPFRRLDSNSDGYLNWPEFDKRYRSILKRGNSFRIRATRPFSVDTEDPRSADENLRASYLMRVLDQDADGKLTVQEIISLLTTKGLPKPLLERFQKLDTDNSGAVSPQELQPLATLLPNGPTIFSPTSHDSPAKSNLPADLPFSSADRNRDGQIEQGEIVDSLRRLHPSLARWSKRIIEDADSSGDKILSQAELEAAG